MPTGTHDLILGQMEMFPPWVIALELLIVIAVILYVVRKNRK